MKKNPIPCPQCGRRIFDAENGIKTQTKVITPYDKGPPKDRWRPDFYIKCWKCQATVGYRKIDI